jgi:hypothetical protein
MIYRDKNSEDGCPPVVEARDCEVCGEQFAVPVDTDYTVCDRDHDE